MKRILLCILALILILSQSVCAQINMTVTDSTNNKVRISGDAISGGEVFLMVLGDGMTEEDVKAGEAGSVIYARAQTAKNGEYAFDFTMNTPDGGNEFSAIVSCDGQKETLVFSFYSDTIKKEFIEDINSGEIKEDAAWEALEMFNLHDDPLSQDVDSSKLASLLEVLKEENDGFSGNTSEFSNILKQALIINALNNGNEELFFEDTLLFLDVLKIDTLPEYEDYDDINSEGISDIKETLLSSSYEGLEELKETFKETVHLNILTNYKELGYGHVKTFFEKYEEEYETAGFNLDLLKKVSSKNEVYSHVASSSKDSLSLLAQDFNKKAKSLSESSGGSGGGGGGGGGGGNTTVSTDSTDPIGYLPKDTENEPSGNGGQEGGPTFTDVSKDFWAAEYIYALSEKGIINGRGNNTFSPFDMVTRSEFVKMIVLALEITPDESLCTFSDMTSSWAKPYVGVAVREGFVSGMSETEFAPDLTINREQASTMVARALKLSAPEVFNVFTDDKNISDYARGYVYALRAKGIIDGRASDAGFAPADGLSRAEAAKIIYLMIQ